MIQQKSLLVSLIMLVDCIPTPPLKQKRIRGRHNFYHDRLFLKAIIIMIVRNLHKVHELLSVLELPTPEMQELRILLSQDGRFPSRRTWERRLKAIPEYLPAQIAYLGRYLVQLINPWEHIGRAVAIDSTLLRAKEYGIRNIENRGLSHIHPLILKLIGRNQASWLGDGNYTLSAQEYGYHSVSNANEVLMKTMVKLLPNS